MLCPWKTSESTPAFECILKYLGTERKSTGVSYEPLSRQQYHASFSRSKEGEILVLKRPQHPWMLHAHNFRLFHIRIVFFRFFSASTSNDLVSTHVLGALIQPNPRFRSDRWYRICQQVPKNEQSALQVFQCLSLLIFRTLDLRVFGVNAAGLGQKSVNQPLLGRYSFNERSLLCDSRNVLKTSLQFQSGTHDWVAIRNAAGLKQSLQSVLLGLSYAPFMSAPAARCPLTVRSCRVFQHKQ